MLISIIIRSAVDHDLSKFDLLKGFIMEHERLLTVKQVAERLQCSTRTVHRLADDNKLPKPVRVGRLVRWRECDIAVFMKGIKDEW